MLMESGIWCRSCSYVPSDPTCTSVKVSDYTFRVNARTAHASGPQPLRYLAPESLQKERYNEKSDVWGFGVMAWEFLTNGNIPYFTTENADVVQHVVRGGRLSTPTIDDVDSLWSTVLPCLATKPKDRPTFAQLVVGLTSVVVSQRVCVFEHS